MKALQTEVISLATTYGFRTRLRVTWQHEPKWFDRDWRQR